MERKNNNIHCTVSVCTHHASSSQVCSLDRITIGKTNRNVDCSDCSSGYSCNKGVCVESFPQDYVSYWKFDNDANDSGPGGNDGTLFDNASLIYDVDDVEMKIGELCELNSQLRPNIVWFGEAVPMIEQAISLMHKADIVLVIGTSLQVYPAAGLIHVAPDKIQKFVVDPNLHKVNNTKNLTIINKKATDGLPLVASMLLESD